MKQRNETLHNDRVQMEAEHDTQVSTLKSLNSNCHILKENNQKMEAKISSESQQETKKKRDQLALEKTEKQNKLDDLKTAIAQQQISSKQLKVERDGMKENHKKLQQDLKDKTFNKSILGNRAEDDMKIVEQLFTSRMEYKASNILDQNLGITDQIVDIIKKIDKSRSDFHECEIQKKSLDDQITEMSVNSAEKLEVLKTLQAAQGNVHDENHINNEKFKTQSKRLQEQINALVLKRQQMQLESEEKEKAFEAKNARLQRKIILHDDDSMSTISSSLSSINAGMHTYAKSSDSSSSNSSPGQPQKRRKSASVKKMWALLTPVGVLEFAFLTRANKCI